MQTLPQPGSSESEARAVSAILARANPAEMPAMRASLSFLTSAGAEMANALAKRNQEYDELKAIIAVLPPEWIDAARTGTSLPDFGSLRAELELAKDERIDLNGQLVERDRLISALQAQLSQAPAAPDEAASQASAAEVDQLNAQVDALRGELETAALARVQAEDGLRASEAELGDFENRLVGLRDELAAALPEEVQAQLPPAPVNGQAQDTRQRRAARLGALAAAISALIDRNRQNDEGLQAANTQMAAVQEEFQVISADRMALEADLQEKVQTLEDQQAQLDRLQSHQETLSLQIEQQTEQITELQTELDNTLAAKTQIEEQLQLREGELAELHQQVDSVAQQLRDVLPEELVAQLTAGDAEVAEPADETLAEEGDEALATRGAAPKMLGLGALAAGVAAAVDLSKEKSGEASQASEQLALVADQRVGLESALSEKDLALADLQAQIEALQAQSADAQGQIDAALAARAELEQELSQRADQVSLLEGQIQDATSRLQELIPAEDLSLPEVALGEEGEAAAEGEAAGVAPAVGLAALVTGVAAMAQRSAGAQTELGVQIETLQAQIEGLGQEKISLEALLGQKEQDLAGYNDYSLGLQGQVNELSSRATGVETALVLKEQAFDEAQAQGAALAAQIDELNAQVAELQGQLDVAASAQAELQGQLDATAGARSELEQTLNASQEQLAAAQAELAQIDEESQRALGEKAVRIGAVGAGAAAVAAIHDKEAELAAANEQLQTLQAQVDGLSAERAELALGKDALQADLNSREAELAELRAQLEALQAQSTQAVEERAALQEQLAEVQEDLSEVEQLRSAAMSFGNAAALSDALAHLPAIKKHAVTAAIVAGVQPTLSPRVQTLNDVKGIGSAYQQRLYGAGIGTYWELASVPDADLETTLEIPELQRARIDFEVTRADAYEWAKLTDSVGLLWDGDHVDDFEQLAGIGKTFEKRLYEAGITTYEQLAACSIESLADIIKPPPMREVHYDEWKEAARQLLAAREAGQPAE
jgi:predicted flap endonuclease-1-like 5' DNA nuclease